MQHLKSTRCYHMDLEMNRIEWIYIDKIEQSVNININQIMYIIIEIEKKISYKQNRVYLYIKLEDLVSKSFVMKTFSYDSLKTFVRKD